MRYIDSKREIAMYDIKARAKVILMMAEEYDGVFSNDKLSNGNKMDRLDEIWRIITTNQIALTEVLRENGL